MSSLQDTVARRQLDEEKLKSLLGRVYSDWRLPVSVLLWFYAKPQCAT
jgi:hypothetical protein